MKSIITTFLLFLSIAASGQLSFSYSKYINGYWGKWEDASIYLANGAYDEFIIYPSSEHPSKYILKVKIFNLRNDIDKEEKKRRKKENDWYEYHGVIEYYTGKGWTKTSWINLFPFVYGANQKGGNINNEPVIIGIAPYKKNPKTYNIMFNGVGIGISLQ